MFVRCRRKKYKQNTHTIQNKRKQQKKMPSFVMKVILKQIDESSGGYDESVRIGRIRAALSNMQDNRFMFCAYHGKMNLRDVRELERLREKKRAKDRRCSGMSLYIQETIPFSSYFFMF